MYIKEFTLQQHTPIIHFQWNETGATLRASEVKPKLDRFITKEIPKHWEEIKRKFSCEIDLIEKAINNQKSSLYAVSIKLENNNKNEWYYFDSAKPPPPKGKWENEKNDIEENLKRTFNKNHIKVIFGTPLFLNRDKVKDNKWDEVILGVTNNSDIKLKIKTQNGNILELLGEVIPIFLTFENFGNRQNKGFGSFHIKDFNTEALQSILKTKYKVVKYKKFNTSENPLQIINNVYKLMKNDPTKIKKLKLKNYYGDKTHKNTYDWEKNVTSNFIANNNRKLKERERYVRAILGLANLYDYPQNTPKKQLIISDPKKEIKRFQSPVTFKVVDNFIYLFCNNVPDNILNKTFRFEDNKTKKYIDITTPDYFNPIDFLNQLEEWKTL